MSNNNDIKKTLIIKDKYKKEISTEPHTTENIINIEIPFKSKNIKDEKNLNKSNYLIYHKNSVNIGKNETPKKLINDISRKKSEKEENLFSSEKNIKSNRHKNSSESTNNSSIDEDNKMSDNDKKILNTIKKAINENKNYKISSAINNAKILESFKKDNFKINNMNYNSLDYNNGKLNNSNLNINNNFNFNYNNIIDLNKYKNYKYILTYNYYLYTDKLKNIKSELKDVENEIKLLSNKTLQDLFLSQQSDELFNYINLKNNNSDNNDKIKLIKDNKIDAPKHLYFYTNHEEETQINNILYLIEGLFLDNNLKKDYFLLNMLNRDGYAPLKKLVNHPQINNCKISESHLKTVFSEHRENEITETVETFDDILIRNKKWIKLKKEIGSVLEVKESIINIMENKKNSEMETLLDKKQNLINKKNKILFKFQSNNMDIQQQINSLQFNYNNIYNNNFNNIYNNNLYNNNIYNNNIYNNNIYNNFYNNNINNNFYNNSMYNSLYNNQRY